MRKIKAHEAKNGYYLYGSSRCLFIRQGNWGLLLFENDIGINFSIKEYRKIHGKQFNSYFCLPYNTIGTLTCLGKIVPNNVFFKKLYPDAIEQGKFLEVPYVF